MPQPLKGVGSIEETNRLLGGQYFDNTGKSLKEFVPAGTPATPAGILSSSAGKSVVATKINPVIQVGTQAQTTAAQNQTTNQASNASQAETDAANATPEDMYDPLQARAEENRRAQMAQLRQEQQLYSEMAVANTAQTQAQVRTLQGAWGTVQRQQQETNRSAEANLTTAGLRSGTARYAPAMNEGLIAAQKSYGIQQLQEIDFKYNEAIASANAALMQGNLQIAMASAKASQNYLEQAGKEINDQITNAQKVADEIRKYDRDWQMYQKKTKFDQAIKQSDPLYKLQLEKVRKSLLPVGPTEKQLAAVASATKNAKSSVLAAQDKISAIDILSDHGGIGSRVGATPFTRGPQGFWGTVGRVATVAGIPQVLESAVSTATGSGQEFAGGIHKLISGLSLQELIEAKSRGATFGALSDSELRVLSSSASAIADWEIKDKGGKGTGFWDVDQASFERELGNIKMLTQRALQASGGTVISDDEQNILDAAFEEEESQLDPSNYY